MLRSADGWVHGFVHLPGRNADYAAGRITPRVGARHETVGRNSTPIGMNGYFHALIKPDAPAEQYAQLDAITWHMCEYNPLGPGCELERFPGEPMTATMAYYSALWVAAVAEALPIGLGEYRGPRIRPAVGFVGWLNHGDAQLDACDNHTDGWTVDEWLWILDILGGASPTPVALEDGMRCIQNTVESGGNGQWWLFTDTGYDPIDEVDATNCRTAGIPTGPGSGPLIVWLMGNVNANRARIAADTAAAITPSSTTAGGATVDQVKGVVDAAESRIRVDVNRPRQVA
jgi:hypothetical protein